MATDVILRLIKADGSTYLEATDPFGGDVLKGLTTGEMVRAVITRPRRIKHHRLAFGLLQAVFEQQDQFPTFNHFINAMKMATGLMDEVMGFDGKIFYVPSSISFAAMDQKDFSEWWDRALKVIFERILPNIKVKDFERHIYEMLGERYHD